MSTDTPRHDVSHADRDLECQEAIEPLMREILDRANQNGWGTVESFNAMEEVLKNLRLAYAEDPDPVDDVAETIVNDFISPQETSEGQAFLHGRDSPGKSH